MIHSVVEKPFYRSLQCESSILIRNQLIPQGAQLHLVIPKFTTMQSVPITTDVSSNLDQGEV